MLSCSNDEEVNDHEQNLQKEETSFLRKLNVNGSIGDLHNYHVHEVYNILINESNISNHRVKVNDYFKTVDNIDDVDFVMDCYDKILDNSDYIFSDVISNNVKTKINELNLLIDTSDFENEDELTSLIYQYNSNLAGNDKIIWDVYVDTFIHSYVYWANNVELWDNMKISNSILQSTYGDNPCSGKKFLARMWCYIKGYVGADSAGAGAAATKLLIEGKNMQEQAGAIAAAGAASSIGYAIGQIFKKL